MTFSAACILGEFLEAASLGRAVPTVLVFTEMVARQQILDRARWLRNYHRLHARPEWRKARAAKMRAYRSRRRALPTVSGPL